MWRNEKEGKQQSSASLKFTHDKKKSDRETNLGFFASPLVATEKGKKDRTHAHLLFHKHKREPNRADEDLSVYQSDSLPLKGLTPGLNASANRSLAHKVPTEDQARKSKEKHKYTHTHQQESNAEEEYNMPIQRQTRPPLNEGTMRAGVRRLKTRQSKATAVESRLMLESLPAATLASAEAALAQQQNEEAFLAYKPAAQLESLEVEEPPLLKVEPHWLKNDQLLDQTLSLLRQKRDQQAKLRREKEAQKKLEQEAGEERKRKEALAAAPSLPQSSVPNHPHQLEDSKPSSPSAPASGFLEEAKKYMAFKKQVKEELVDGGKVPAELRHTIAERLRMSINSIADEGLGEKVALFQQQLQELQRLGNRDFISYFCHKLSRVLYAQIGLKSKLTGKNDPGTKLVIHYAHLCMMLNSHVGGLIDYFRALCLAKCPLLIPLPHPPNQLEQEYRISLGLRDVSPEGNIFDDSLTRRDARLQKVALFYCTLVNGNPERYMGECWISLCQLMNSRVTNHVPTIVRTLLGELGPAFARHYNEQFHNLLQYVHTTYIPRLLAESPKFGAEATLFHQKGLALRFLVEELQANLFRR